MKFSGALAAMKDGFKVALPEWKGHWAWENGTIMMYCANGDVIDFRSTNDPDYTLGNICREDWVVVV